MSGWDFSALVGRLCADEPWWDFEQDCFAALQASEIGALDLGTGGGERLSGLLDRFSRGTQLPPTVLATEGWKPNIPIARTRLAPYGVQVIEYDSEIKQHLDLAEGRLDLVMSRHESFDPGELSRVLVPGGDSSPSRWTGLMRRSYTAGSRHHLPIPRSPRRTMPRC